MPTLWQHIRGRFDRSRNSKWGWRVSALYGMCVWTLLGVVVVKMVSGSTSLVAKQYGMSAEAYAALSKKEKERLAHEAKLKTLIRQQEIAEHVAENIYAPVDFMG